MTRKLLIVTILLLTLLLSYCGHDPFQKCDLGYKCNDKVVCTVDYCCTDNCDVADKNGCIYEVAPDGDECPLTDDIWGQCLQGKCISK